MLGYIWNYKVQIIPVILALAVFEIPNVIRRLKRFYYVPIYFSVFPFRELNADLSVYLGEDYFVGQGAELSEGKAEELRKRLILISVISMVVAAVLTPLVTGFIGAFFLTPDTLVQFLVVLVVYKIIGLVKSVLAFHQHAIATTRNRLFLGLIYSYTWELSFI